MAASHLAEVHTLYATNASDIVAMLREAADNIESGACGDIASMTAVAESPEGVISIFGWGQTDTARSIAVLHMGLAKLTIDHLAATEPE